MNFLSSRYIYCGSVNLTDYGIPTILDFLVSADELILEDLIDYLQTYLIEQHSDALKENFASLHEIVFEYDSITQLQEHLPPPNLKQSSSRMISNPWKYLF